MSLRYVLTAVVVIVCVSVGGVVIRPSADVIQFIGIIIAATVPSLFAIAQLTAVRADVRQVHDQVNGHMSELVEKIPDPKQRRDMRNVLREEKSD